MLFIKECPICIKNNMIPSANKKTVFESNKNFPPCISHLFTNMQMIKNTVKLKYIYILLIFIKYFLKNIWFRSIK